MGLRQHQRQQHIRHLLATEREIATLQGRLEARLPAAVYHRLVGKLEGKDLEQRLDYLLKAANRLQAIVEIVEGADRVVLISQGRVMAYKDGQAYPDIPMHWDVAAHVAGQLGRQVSGRVIERAGCAANTPALEDPTAGSPTQVLTTTTSPPRQINLVVTYEADGTGAFARIHDGGELTEFKADGRATEPPLRTLSQGRPRFQLLLWDDQAINVAPKATYAKPERRSLTIQEIPESERPVHRLHHYGANALSTTELLAILLGNPHQLQDAASLLAAFDDLVGVARAPSTELQQQPGVGATTAARIKAVLELGTRLTMERNHSPQIRSPADAANLLIPEMSLLEQEHLRVILLDTKNHVLGIPTIYIGSVNTTMIRISELFREAIRRQCVSIIICHNHPSGSIDPSPEDLAVTRQAVEAGKLLDIQVLDHILVGRGQWVSLKERGMGFD